MYGGADLSKLRKGQNQLRNTWKSNAVYLQATGKPVDDYCYFFDPANWEWKQIEPEGVGPGPRAGHSGEWKSSEKEVKNRR